MESGVERKERDKKVASSLSRRDSTPIVSRDNGHCSVTKAKHPKYWRKSYCSFPAARQRPARERGRNGRAKYPEFNLSPSNPVTRPNGHVSAAAATATGIKKVHLEIPRTSASLLARPRGNTSLFTMPNLA